MWNYWDSWDCNSWVHVDINIWLLSSVVDHSKEISFQAHNNIVVHVSS